MRTLSMLIFSSLLFALPAFAGSGHEHDHDHDNSHEQISSKNVISKATTVVHQLAAKGKIDSSWSKINIAFADQKEYSHGLEWVVTFKNKKIKDPSMQTLYLFYSLEGHYIATNYTGQ